MLDRILETKREELKTLTMPEEAPVTRYSLTKALRAEADEVQVIAEVKKASPSKGLIRSPFDPADIARQYEKGGAAALSVLTDETYFQGSRDYLTEVKHKTGLPVLRKDFMIEETQIEESRRMGADAVLLIAAALEPKKLHDLYLSAVEKGMEVLVECHSLAELDAVLGLFCPMLIGINNRDLTTFETTLQVTNELSRHIPPETLLVSESGIHTPEDMAFVQQAGAKAVLVGESLMRRDDVESALRALKGES
ncbi:indole-3-glycerol phosphate synthase TrpC [Salibacterium qingdaonense]|uniref:Indole-3-glycerol phosphate synthase n=1 Tax=Salibacterium qingdaonense TaxID=266892 RepID=A0A1I4M3E9_9BACI|nr:indole-3-glycerol phosphate synthase TrpC [Salibacterium qingdaonense]SFL97771.1 indole-3-glycerol phosphate synthase [Salibacterium qingdaonense]